jgi:hypothetical protein
MSYELIELTKSDEKQLLKLGYLREDLPQIKRLSYSFEYCGKKTEVKEIKKRSEIVGNAYDWNDVLAGIGRSAFHGTCSIGWGGNCYVESNLFRTRKRK